MYENATTVKQFALAHSDLVDYLESDCVALKTAQTAGDDDAVASAEVKLINTMHDIRELSKGFSPEAPESSASPHLANPEGTAAEDVTHRFNARFSPAKLGDGTLLAILQKLLSSVGGLSGLISIIMGLITSLGGGTTPPAPAPAPVPTT